ncbi:MAG: RHS repeat-associated core domain-containing protein [Candidatus Riflebacteria bacterium]|nr:RHS repeat-associated core domain-containing protein [Candidatus Riflebacteria bacterium]
MRSFLIRLVLIILVGFLSINPVLAFASSLHETIPDTEFGNNCKEKIPSEPDVPDPQPVECPNNALPTVKDGDNTGLQGGDPVSLFSGNLVLTSGDLLLNSRLPISLSRCYNSRDAYAGPFGKGWSASCLSRLDFSDTKIVFTNTNGSRVTFQRNGDTFIPPQNTDLTLSVATSTQFWTVKHPSEGEFTFDSDGKILRIARACCGKGVLDAINFEYDSAGRLTKMSNPDAQSFTFTYDDQGHITQVNDSTGRQVQYTYNPRGNLISCTDPLNHTTSYTYNVEGFITRVEEPGSKVTQIFYENQRVTKQILPDGGEILYDWDGTSRTLRLTDQAGTTHQYDFLERSQLARYSVESAGITKEFTSSGTALVRKVSSNGAQKNFVYDDNGRLIQKTDAMGNVTEFTWHPTLAKLTSKKDSLGRTWQYKWCSRGNLIKETDPAGGEITYTYDSYNNRTSRKDQKGRKTQYFYDQIGSRLIKVIDAAGGISSFTYDPRGNLATSSDQLGRKTSSEYDVLNRLTKTTYPDGRYTTIEYDEAGNVALRRDNLNRETRYEYTPSGKVSKIIRPDGSNTSYVYDAKDRKISETDTLGNVTSFVYDALNHLIETRYPDGSSESFSYDTEGQLISRRNELGENTGFEYDLSGRLLATTDPAGNRWESAYDAADRKVSDKDPLSRVTLYNYDNLDRLVKTQRPDSTTIENVYDTVGNLLKTIDSLGASWTWQYDELDRQIKSIRPDAASSTTSYDAAGQIIAETDTLGRTTSTTFDAAGRRTKVTDPAGAIWKYAYDKAGRLVSTTDPTGSAWKITYDLMDRIVSECDPLYNVTRYEYDLSGRKTSAINPLSQKTQYAYDTRGRLISETDAQGNTVSYTYDEAGRRISLSDGENRTWQWEYDSLGRVIAEIDPFGARTVFSYDTVGNRISTVNAREGETRYTFNSMNRLEKVIYPNGSIATFSYNAEGMELSRSSKDSSVIKTWSATGDLLSEEFGPYNKSWKYQYDKAGNRIKATSPEGDTFKYSYDKANRLTELAPTGFKSKISYTYDLSGRINTVSRHGVDSRYSYDKSGRITELRHERDSKKDKLLALRRYEYDAAGNRTKITDEDNGVASFTYNASGWLTGATYPDKQIVKYQYNASGDRVSEAIGKSSVIYEYDPAGRMIKRGSDTYEYDADGNLIKAIESGLETIYSWSSDNRLTKIEREVMCKKHSIFHCRKCPRIFEIEEEYGYLPEDWRRISRITQGTEFFSVYDGEDESHEYVVTPKNVSKKWRFGPLCWKAKLPKLHLYREFVSGPQTDDIEATRYHCRDVSMLKDALGSTIALTNRNGNLISKIGYDAWGNFKWPDKKGYGTPPCKEDDLCDLLDRLEGRFSLGGIIHDHWHHGRHFAKSFTPYLYTGRRLSAVSEHYFNRNRYYNPKHGRFISKDPIGFNGGNNFYRYADNNPILLFDPFGNITVKTQAEADQVKMEVSNQNRNLKLIAMLFVYWKPGDSFHSTLFNPDWVKSMGFDVENPNSGGFAADAAGSRGKHYKKSPQIIKNAIDEMEAGVILNASHLARFVFQSEWFLNRSHGGASNNEKFMMIWIINEFERTQKTIEILQSGLDAWEKCNKP